jgi:hypothetical protein
MKMQYVVLGDEPKLVATATKSHLELPLRKFYSLYCWGKKESMLYKSEGRNVEQYVESLFSFFGIVFCWQN